MSIYERKRHINVKDQFIHQWLSQEDNAFGQKRIRSLKKTNCYNVALKEKKKHRRPGWPQNGSETAFLK